MGRRGGLFLVGAALLAAIVAATLGLPGLGGSGPGPADVPGFVHEGERLTFEPAAEQTIAGRTRLDNGTTLAVRLRTGGENPFLVTRSARVDESGSFAATFDLSGVAAGTTLHVAVVRDGERLLNATATVVA